MRCLIQPRGFTLVELLAVASIVVMLILLAVPRIQGAALASKQARVDKDLKTIHEALERHFTDLGYYPVKLNDLIKAGYIKQGEGMFKSPLCKCWYFYAVDNNDDNQARAYVLGAPSPLSPSTSRDDGNDLYHNGPLPRGWHPGSRAWGWKFFPYGRNLVLYREDNKSIIPEAELPDSLASYRTGCQPGSTQRCDLWSN